MDTVKQADPTNWSSLNQEQLVDLASSLNNFFNQAGLLSSQNQHSTGQFSSVVWFYPTPTSHSALFSSINQAGLLCSQNQHSNGQLFSVVLGPPPPPPHPFFNLDGPLSSQNQHSTGQFSLVLLTLVTATFSLRVRHSPVTCMRPHTCQKLCCPYSTA